MGDDHVGKRDFLAENLRIAPISIARKLSIFLGAEK